MSEEDIGRSEVLDQEVKAVDSPLKELIVNYVGNNLNLQESVTVEDLVEVFAQEFPEFLLAVAEENFIRGYRQAIMDMQEHYKLSESQENSSQAS